MTVNRRMLINAAVIVALLGCVKLVVGLTTGSAHATNTKPLTRVLVDPFADATGYHESAEEPSIIAAKNPARAGAKSKQSTILVTEQVGRVYDGGASDIGYEVSLNGGKTWKHGELPLTVQGGQATTCGGTLNRASDTVNAYDKKHDVWLVSTLGLTGNAGIGHGNFYLEKGVQSAEQIVAGIANGFYVTELMGFGVNVVTGDYSRGAAGFWVEKGEIAYPVQEITIAGNLKDVFRGITAVGNDVVRRGSRYCGSILIDNMTIAGN